MTDDVDNALANTADALNEDSKAKRRKSGGKAAIAAASEHLGAGALPAEDDGLVQEGDPAELAATVERIGQVVAAKDGGTEGLDLSEGAHNKAMESAERAATEWEFNPASLISDLRDMLLDQIKRRPKPWGATSRDEQQDVANACQHAAQEAVRKAVEAIAARGQDPVRVLLTKVTLGDDIVIAGKVKTHSVDEEDEAVRLLHSARGKHVMLTVASKDDYNEQQRDAEVMPDEPGLNFEAGPLEDDDVDPTTGEPRQEGDDDA